MAFRTQKISQMTPKGSDLEATDLIEVSTIESGSYVTRSITGQELIDAIPVPPSGITIGSTAIASGVVGRVLFEGAGNVVQESANLFWDATNNRLGVGTSTPLRAIDVFASSPEIATRIASNGTGKFSFLGNAGGEIGAISLNGSSGEMRIFTSFTYFPTFYSSGSEAMRIATTGNVLIGTTTDAGFRLDVNGTARVQGQLTLSNSTFPQLNISGTANNAGIFLNRASTSFASQIRFQTASSDIWTWQLQGNSTNNLSAVRFNGSWLESMTLFYSTGNVGINTTADAGFRLDVNGTARVQSTLTVSAGGAIITGQLQANNGLKTNVVLNNTFNTNSNSLTIFQSSDALGEARFYGSVCAGFVSTINNSAILQAESTTKGFLPPRMTTTQKNAIATPAAGLMVYDTTLNVISYYNGTMWI